MYGGRAGSITFSFDSIRTATAAQRAAKRYYFHKKRCRVVGLYGKTARTFRRVVARLDQVIRSRAFGQVLGAKKRFGLTHDTATVLLDKLRRRPVRVVANTFERTTNFPCPANYANGHTNAFARRGVTLLLIHRPYLKRHTRSGSGGLQKLARIIIHETLHTLGYSHRGLKAWSQPYMNTVAPFVGCVVEHFPANLRLSRAQARRLATFCAMATRKQRQVRSRTITPKV